MEVSSEKAQSAEGDRRVPEVLLSLHCLPNALQGTYLGGNLCAKVPVPRKAPLTPWFPLSHYKHMCGCVYASASAHTHTRAHTGCPRGLCDMLYLIFIPSLQSPSPQGASVSLSPPLALAVLLVFHIPQNEQLPRSGLLLGRVLEGCQPPDLT